MGKRLIIAEKPKVGKFFGEVLKLGGKGDKGYIEGDDTIVSWCIGHLIESVEPDAYDPALKKWGWSTLPMLPERFKYRPVEDTRSQWDVVKKLLMRDDVSEVVCATDAGREGELIFYLVYTLAGCKKPVKRFWGNSMTPDALKADLAKMKPWSDYKGLTDAARSRSEADWLVGMNLTRAQTLAGRALGGDGVYVVGRVKTPVLAMLVNRELEIKNFKPKDFWGLTAFFDSEVGAYKGKWFKKVDGEQVQRVDTDAEVKALRNKVDGKAGRILSSDGTEVKTKPPLFFDLGGLQVEANNRFGFTGEKTLEITQELYEAGYVTYPRTNSKHLTKDEATKNPAILNAMRKVFPTEMGLLDAVEHRKLDGRYIDDAEVEDHTAILPTPDKTPNLASLDDKQKSIYEMVAKRFMAVHMPDKVEFKTVIITEVEGETFKTNGNVIRNAGWSAIDDSKSRKPAKKGKKKSAEEEPEEEEESGLPPVTKGMSTSILRTETKADKTKPPSRFTEATLLEGMMSAGKDLDDEELRGAMKDVGLGTPATRASTIEELIRQKMAERKGRVFHATDKGVDLIQRIKVDKLKTPEMTGQWEAELARMARGQGSREDFVGKIRVFVSELVAEVRASIPAGSLELFEEVKMGQCPKCSKGDQMLKKFKDRYYVQCSEKKCAVSYGTDAHGSSLGGQCKFCKGPVSVTKSGSKICVICEKWQEERLAKDIGPCVGRAGEKLDGEPCRGRLILRKGTDNHYVKCDQTETCKVTFNTDATGKPTGGACKVEGCGGPIYVTQKGSKRCVVCGAWDNEGGGGKSFGKKHTHSKKQSKK